MDQSQNVRRINSTNTCVTPESSKARSSPTFEQLLHVSDSGKDHKKSVLSKVKEKAKKIKRSLSKKKRDHDNDNNNTFQEGGNGDEEHETNNKTDSQKPRTISRIVSDKATKTNHDVDELAESTPSQQLIEPCDSVVPTNVDVVDTTNNKIASDVSYRKSLSTVGESSTEENKMVPTSRWKQTWGRSFSMRDYFMQKLEPGEDEKALSNVITEAMKSDGGEAGVVEKVKEAVSSLLHVENDEKERPEEQEQEQTSNRTQNEKVAINFPASPIPISTNAHEYYNEEETQGRILQTN